MLYILYIVYFKCIFYILFFYISYILHITFLHITFLHITFLFPYDDDGDEDKLRKMTMLTVFPMMLMMINEDDDQRQ